MVFAYLMCYVSSDCECCVVFCCWVVCLCWLVVFEYLMCYMSSDCECCVMFCCWVVLGYGVCILDALFLLNNLWIF